MPRGRQPLAPRVSFRERTLSSLIDDKCVGQILGARMARLASAHFEPVAWWYTRQQIGRGLRKYYEPANDLPPRLFLLVRKLDEGFEISARDSSAANRPQSTWVADLCLAALIAAIVAASFRFHFVF